MIISYEDFKIVYVYIYIHTHKHTYICTCVCVCIYTRFAIVTTDGI